MPVLARLFEASGLATVLVTMMPIWAEKTGVPRTLAVDRPFGQTLGRPHDVKGQMSIIRQALYLLEIAQTPGVIFHYPDNWPVQKEVAIKDWQPPEPSPIIQHLTPRIREMVRNKAGLKG